ncbi:MAG: radical SAM protein [Thermotogaceae bacterium]|nr:radical SAM protein [Thermotogaceae bacterium]
MVLRASYGTLALLGYNEKIVEGQQTAFFMLDGKCVFDCWFCSHARNAKTPSKFLSRVTWKEVDLSEAAERAKKSPQIKRICLQVVSYSGYKEDIVEALNKFSGKPVSVSVRATNFDEVKLYFDSGADMVGISIDAATDKLYRKIRGGSIKEVLNLLERASLEYPGRITTHLIVGLGETEKEMIGVIDWLLKRNITVALFAFTPIKGTKLENHKKPPLSSYRRIQLAHFLLKKKLISFEDIRFNEKGEIVDFGIDIKEISEEYIKKAFLTQGCPNCRRPFYNESPKGVLYNIHDERLLEDFQLPDLSSS